MSKTDRMVLVQRRKRVFDSFFKIDEFTVTHSKVDGEGVLEDVVRLVFERGDSASALLHNLDDDTVILTEQFRMPTYEKGAGWMIETIAGAIEPGETPEACIRREILEEVGYSVTQLEPISRFYVSPGGTSERIVLFYAAVRNVDLVNPAASGLAEQQEDVLRISTPREDFIEGCFSGQYEDAKTVIAGMWLARNKTS